MGWRTVLVSNRAKLEQSLGYLVVRGETTTRIHLSEVSLLLIDSPCVAITSSLMIELMKQKIKIILCDEKHNPMAEMVDQYGSCDSSLKLRGQIAWSADQKELVWTALVREKISKQALHLKKREHGPEAALLERYLEELLPNDRSNREGHAAKVYFNALFGKGFSRKEDTPVNAALNYGYSLILSCFNKEINGKGYLTQLGLFHENQFNPFNLSSDFMEPFRPLVDAVVVDLNPRQFEKEERRKLLEMLNRDVQMVDEVQKLTQVISIFTDRTITAIQEKDPEKMVSYEWFAS